MSAPLWFGLALTPDAGASTEPSTKTVVRLTASGQSCRGEAIVTWGAASECYVAIGVAPVIAQAVDPFRVIAISGASDRFGNSALGSAYGIARVKRRSRRSSARYGAWSSMYSRRSPKSRRRRSPDR